MKRSLLSVSISLSSLSLRDTHTHFSSTTFSSVNSLQLVLAPTSSLSEMDSALHPVWTRASRERLGSWKADSAAGHWTLRSGGHSPEKPQGSKARGLRITFSSPCHPHHSPPPFCPAAARNGTTQGGHSLREKSEGTACKFNDCLNVYTEIYLWVLL